MTPTREDINKQTYSSPKAVEVYSRDYLRPYEKFLIEKYVKSTDHILDVGSGTGRSNYYLSQKTPHVIGIDMVQDFIDKGKELHPELDLRVMNATQLEFPDKSFDIVFFSNQGIDCVDDRAAVLQESKRVLKPGGLFVYTSHNSLSIPRTRRTIVDFFKNIRSWRPGRHIRVEYQPNGELHFMFTNVWVESSFIKKEGFELVEILANRYPSARKPLLFTGLLERWPMYICRKPNSHENSLSHQ